MTHSEIGKAVRITHPGHYDHLPHDVIGRAMVRRFPHLYGEVQPDPVSETPLQKAQARVKKHRAGDKWPKPQTPKG